MRELTFGENELIVSKTDTTGKITYGNELFLSLAGYSENELLGAPHNIIRHKEMPRVIFKFLWDYVKNGQEIYAYVINNSKSGDYYWVCANVTPSYDKNDKIIGYYSVRRKPSQKALEVVKPLYKQLLDAERSGGMEASQKIVEALLEEKGIGYDEFVLSL